MGLPSVIGGPDPYRDYDGPVCPECQWPVEEAGHATGCAFAPCPGCGVVMGGENTRPEPCDECLALEAIEAGRAIDQMRGK